MKPTALLLVLCLTSPALAWLGPSYEDDEVVARSEAIVVGSIKDGSIRRVDHDRPPGEGRSWEHHATLVVMRVIKGKVAGQEIPLIVHYTSRQSSKAYEEAHQSIVAAGPVAGPYLLGVYRSTHDSNLRQDVIRVWAKIRWGGCVEELTKLLEQQDRFWATQKLEPGWWNKDIDSPLPRRRRDMYGEVYAAVHALRQIGDPAARDVLELTRRRWAAIDFDNPQIVEECQAALKQWAAR